MYNTILNNILVSILVVDVFPGWKFLSEIFLQGVLFRIPISFVMDLDSRSLGVFFIDYFFIFFSHTFVKLPLTFFCVSGTVSDIL